MKLHEIRAMPTTLTAEQCRRMSGGGCHESVLRSSHILDKVEEWLAIGVDSDAILELIEDLRMAPDPAPQVDTPEPYVGPS